MIMRKGLRKGVILEMEVLRLRGALEAIRKKHPEILECQVLDKIWFKRTIGPKTKRSRYTVLPKEDKVPKIAK